MAEQKADKIEREYIINLKRKINGVPIYKRAPKAIKTIKEFLARHMKIYDRDLNKVKLDKYLNEFLWARGIKNPQTRIKIKAVKEGDMVRAELSETIIPIRLKFKKTKEERREQKASEIVSRKKEEKIKEEQKQETTPEKTEEKKEEEKEKKAAVVEVGKEMEKAAKRMRKHEAKVKSKEPKRQFRQALQK